MHLGDADCLLRFGTDRVGVVRQAVRVDPLEPGLYEVLITARLEQLLDVVNDRFDVRRAVLQDAESSDRVSRYVAGLVSQAVESFPEEGRARAAIALASAMLLRLNQLTRPELDLTPDLPIGNGNGNVLEALLRRRPDGSAEPLDRPLTPLLDTTILTNAPGEPAVAHELAAEIPSADRIDALMAFIRWSGIRRFWRV